MPRLIPQMAATVFAFLVVLNIAQQASAYDYPLSPSAIREAYFLGGRQVSVGKDFLAGYTRRVPELREGGCTSEVRIVTPFKQVAEYTAKTLSYNAQDAVKEFSNKPMFLRIYLDICYMSNPLPDSLRIRTMQNGKEVMAVSDDRSAYYLRTDKHHTVASVGEHVQLEFEPQRFDSSTLTILIATPDGRSTEVEFPLQTLR